jgi:hypothetical protein
LVFPWIGAAAALGVICFFIGAIVTHLRARWYSFSYPSPGAHGPLIRSHRRARRCRQASAPAVGPQDTAAPDPHPDRPQRGCGRPRRRPSHRVVQARHAAWLDPPPQRGRTAYPTELAGS